MLVGMLQDIIWAVTVGVAVVLVGVAVVLVGLDEAEEVVAMYWQLTLMLVLVVGDWSSRGGDRRGRRPEVLVLPVFPSRRRGWDPTLHVASTVVGGGVWSPGRVVWLLVTGVAVMSVAPRLLVFLLATVDWCLPVPSVPTMDGLVLAAVPAVRTRNRRTGGRAMAAVVVTCTKSPPDAVDIDVEVEAEVEVEVEAEVEMEVAAGDGTSDGPRFRL